MAENEAAAENAAIVHKEEEKKQGPLFVLFPDFRFNFPFMKRDPKAEHAAEEATARTGEEEIKAQKKLDMVRFPDTRPTVPPPLKLEVEESEQQGISRNMWQVYALGGFMILRWIWGRWKERKSKDESSEDPSPEDD